MSRQPLTDDEKETLLNTRIPDRMFEVHLCRRIIEIFNESTLPIPPGADVVIHVGPQTYDLYPPEMLLYIAVDSGILMCRALMNFLGIYYHSRTDALISKRMPRYDTDVCLGDCGKTSLTIDEAYAGLPTRDPGVVGDSLLVTLRTGDIGIGHLTRTAARDIGELHKIALTCNLVLALMNKHLYPNNPVMFEGDKAKRYFRSAS